MIREKLHCTCVSTRRIVDSGTELLNSHNFVRQLRFPCLFRAKQNDFVSSYVFTHLYGWSQEPNCLAAFIVMPTTTTIAELRMVIAFDSV